METGIRGKTYKIGQAAKLLDVKPFVLRFWEGEFTDALVPVRTPSGQRAYTEANIATVREIKRLLYDEGLTIEGAKKRLGQAGQAGRKGRPAARPAPQATHPAAPAAPPASAGQAAPAAQAPQAPQASVQASLDTSLPADTHTDTLREVARELAAIRALLS